MRALGIDFGTKTLGLAITDSNKTIASSLEQFTYGKNDLMACVNKVKQVVKQYNNDIDVIVVGYPVYPSGDKSPTCLIIDKFKDLLHTHLPAISVVLEDERYTTLEATGELKELGFKSSFIKKVKDKMSAVRILDSWLSHGKI